VSPPSPPPPPHRRFLRLLVDIPTFSAALVEQYLPGEDGVVVEYRCSYDLPGVDPHYSGIRLANGALFTVDANRLTDAALVFVPEELRSWVAVGLVLIEACETDQLIEMPALITSEDPGPWAIELVAWPRADRLESLSDRVDAVLATPRFGIYGEWLSDTEGQQVLAAIVAEAPADDLAHLLVTLFGIRPFWAFLSAGQLAKWLDARGDSAVVTAVVEATGAIANSSGDGNFGADLKVALDAHA